MDLPTSGLFESGTQSFYAFVFSIGNINLSHRNTKD